MTFIIKLQNEKKPSHIYNILKPIKIQYKPVFWFFQSSLDMKKVVKFILCRD